jgi:DNA-binding transcriptional LysR family regulator
MILVASPELVAAYGEPQALEDLARIPTLSMMGADGQSTWRFVGTDGEPANLSHSPRLSTDDLSTLRHAALQGIGAVLVPHLLVANDLEGGALIRLLPSLKAHVGVVHAVFPSRRGMVPAVRALLDFFSETVRLLPS